MEDRTTTPCANLPLSYLSISGDLEKMNEGLGGGLAFLYNVIAVAMSQAKSVLGCIAPVPCIWNICIGSPYPFIRYKLIKQPNLNEIHGQIRA